MVRPISQAGSDMNPVELDESTGGGCGCLGTVLLAALAVFLFGTCFFDGGISCCASLTVAAIVIGVYKLVAG